MGSFGALFGAAGAIGSGILQSDAANSATAIQNNAINQIQNNLQTKMSPSTLQQIATQGDQQRAQQQQQLFSQIYPDLATASTAAQRSLMQQAGGFGSQSQASQIGTLAAQTAEQNVGATQQGQNQLIDSALQQLQAGATLPPDVEAQLVQSGLEASGMTTGAASGQGIGGQQLRTILGTAGIQLQEQRQQQAAGLLSQAQQLETQRQSVLTQLFPNLSSTQLQQAQGASGIFQTAQGAVPQAGLSGTQLANAWLQRIGAQNQTIAQGAGVNAQNALAQGNIWSGVIGSVTGAGAGGGGGTSGILSGILGGGGGGGGGMFGGGSGNTAGIEAGTPGT